MQLAASASKICIRVSNFCFHVAICGYLIQSSMYPTGHQYNLHATGGHSGTICMWLAATRVQFVCESTLPEQLFEEKKWYTFKQSENFLDIVLSRVYPSPLAMAWSNLTRQLLGFPWNDYSVDVTKSFPSLQSRKPYSLIQSIKIEMACINQSGHKEKLMGYMLISMRLIFLILLFPSQKFSPFIFMNKSKKKFTLLTFSP